MLRYSLWGLLAAVVFVALSVTALMYANHWWLVGVTTIAWLALCGALTVALLRRGRGRASAIGFVIFGGAYLLTGILPWLADLRGQLITTQLLSIAQRQAILALIEEYGADEADYIDRGYVGGLYIGGQPVPRPTSGPWVEEYFPVGHALAVLWLGCLGALLGRAVAGRPAS